MSTIHKLCGIGRIRILIVLAALFISTLSSSTCAGQTALKIGDALPRISLSDLDGKQVNLPEDATGKIAIIHFWASWCPLCVREMAALESIRTAYAEKGVVPYSIDSGEPLDAVKAYVSKTKATYAVLLDPTMEITKLCGVNSIPTTFVCDRNGVIRFKILGEVSKMGLEKLLSTLL